MSRPGARPSALLVCALTAACGGGAPGGPNPQPTATPSPAFPAGFVHVLSGRELTTYRIDPATGALAATSSQALGYQSWAPGMNWMAADPTGRYVYVAHTAENRWSPDQAHAPAIVTMSPAVANGLLVQVSEAESLSREDYPGYWSSLAAGPNRVLGMFAHTTYHDTYGILVNHAVAANGQIADASTEWADDGDWFHLAADWRTHILYRSNYGHPLSSARLEPDGRSTRLGESRVCGPSLDLMYSVVPRVAVRGLCLSSASLVRGGTTCSHEGLGLEPRADLGIQVHLAAAHDPTDLTLPAQLAVSVTQNEKLEPVRELRLYSVGPGAQLRLQATRTLEGYASTISFHPGGRLLFVGVYNDTAYKLVVYSFTAEGRLIELQRLDQPGPVQVAVTQPGRS